MVSHSMGCTMSLFFLNILTKTFKDKYIKSLVTLGGPWGGAAKALEVFAVGTDFDEKFIDDIPGLSLITKDIVKTVERTQPSLAWMMPSSEVWSVDVLVKTESNSDDYTAANLADYFNLLGVPNMALMHEDTKTLTSSLVDPEVQVCHGHGHVLFMIKRKQK